MYFLNHRPSFKSLSAFSPSYFSSLAHPLSCWMLSSPLALTLSFLAVHTLPPFQATHLRPLLLLQLPGEPFLMLLWPDIQGTPPQSGTQRSSGNWPAYQDAGCRMFMLHTCSFPTSEMFSESHFSPADVTVKLTLVTKSADPKSNIT